MPRTGRTSAAILSLGILFACANLEGAEPTTWKAGVATADITPTEPMWMAGYASRDKPSEGVAQRLFAKALVIEDSAGTRLAIVTMDLIGIQRTFREAVEMRVDRDFKLPPQSLILNASHTHCGPELRASTYELGGLPADRAAQAEVYTKKLQDQVVGIIGEAIQKLAPVNLKYTHGRCGVSMNRRLAVEGDVQNSPNPEGRVDQSVPVLRVENTEGKLTAILFGYACHNTTLGFYQICGDYAGYAQEYLQADFPGVTALFFMGCGGDQNPYPRGKLEQAQQHGRALANAVEAALEWKQPRTIEGPLRVAADEVVLEFAAAPTREELIKLKQSPVHYDRNRAEALLAELDSAGKINTEYLYPIHVAQFGDALTLVALAGEVVVDYSLRLKTELAGPIVWVAGYSNDVFGYVPSVRVLNEGGYEGGGAMRYSTLPGPFLPSVEERIVGKVHELVTQVRSTATSGAE